jgi:hypothetical protein
MLRRHSAGQASAARPTRFIGGRARCSRRRTDHQLIDEQDPALPTRSPTRTTTASIPAATRNALTMTDDGHRRVLRSTRNRPRTAVRRGAASCRAVLRSCSVAAVVRGVLAGVVTAELSGVAERHRCGNPSGIWASQPAVAVAVAVGAVRTPDTPLVALSASAVRRADVRPLVGRTSGVHATGVHATGAIRVSGWTRVRCPRPLRPRCPTGLDPGIRRCGGAAHVWAHRVRRVAGSASGLVFAAESGPGGEGWSCVGSAWLARGSAADLGHRSACAQAAAPCSPPGRPGNESSARVPSVG